MPEKFQALREKNFKLFLDSTPTTIRLGNASLDFARLSDRESFKLIHLTLAKLSKPHGQTPKKKFYSPLKSFYDQVGLLLAS